MINKLINETIEICTKELNKKHTKDKILNPIIECVIEKIKPYILTMSIFFITMILLILCILYLIISK